MQCCVSFRAHGVHRHPGVEQSSDALRHPSHGREVDRPQAAGVWRIEISLRRVSQWRRRGHKTGVVGIKLYGGLGGNQTAAEKMQG